MRDILELFVVENVGGGSFLAPQPTDRDRVRVYGGQVVAQVSFIEKIDGDEEYSTLVRNRAFEMRFIDLPPRISVDGTRPAEAVCRLWLRADDEVPVDVHDDPLLANCLLAYVSDWSILDPVQIGVGKTWQTLDAMASLDHAMWFHRPVDFSDWLLDDQRASSAAGGTGLGYGAIFNRTGELVCTVAQEGYLGRRH